MATDAPLPVLPVYEPPREKTQAVIPNGLEVTKMPGVMNKMISRMLPKAPKMKARLAKVPKLSKPISKHKNTTTKKNRLSTI